ncbi:MAG TPA: multicopper oxidase domain-containing protein, partial [Chitinophagaceae bacterium]|nr:multicopper oxidase domain-containing protein [Chitinophagaceae bacterium]
MKRVFLNSVTILLLVACNQNGTSHNKKYGAPEAKVTSEPNNERSNKGPLAFAPNVPKVEEGDTVNVKFDVTHQLFPVSKTVSYTAWAFGGSVPGPVLRIRVGQTVRFSMTDRSNDTMQNVAMHVNMMPMPHSIDFHSAMVNPEDKYRSINPGETIQYV